MVENLQSLKANFPKEKNKWLFLATASPVAQNYVNSNTGFI